MAFRAPVGISGLRVFTHPGPGVTLPAGRWLRRLPRRKIGQDLAERRRVRQQAERVRLAGNGGGDVAGRVMHDGAARPGQHLRGNGTGIISAEHVLGPIEERFRDSRDQPVIIIIGVSRDNNRRMTDYISCSLFSSLL